MRRSLPTLATLGLVLLAACTDSPSRAPTAPPSGRAGIVSEGLKEDIQEQIGLLLSAQTGLKNAALAQFANIVKSAESGKMNAALSQTGALVNFMLRQQSLGKLSDPTTNAFDDGPADPTTDQALQELIAALYFFLNNHSIPSGSELSHVDAAAVFVPKDAPGTIVVKTGTGLAAVSIPAGALGNDALVTITPIPFDTYQPGQGPVAPEPGVAQYPYFYEISAFAVDPTKPLSSSFNPQVTVEICTVESGPFAPPEAIHSRLQLAHTVSNEMEIVPRVPAPDLVCYVPPSSASLDRPMESEGLLALAGWALRTAPSRIGALLTPNDAYAGHGGLGGLTSSFSPWAAVDPGPPPPSATTLYGVNSADDALFGIDPATGTQTLIGALSTNATYATPVALATRPSDGMLFFWNNSSGTSAALITTGVLGQANSCNGAGTTVNATPSGVQIGALAFSPGGSLYGADGALYSINPSTGVPTQVGTTFPGAVRLSGLAFSSQGILYGLELALPPAGPRLYTVDPASGGLTLVTTLPSTVGLVGDMTFSPSGTLLVSATNSSLTQTPGADVLFDLDPATGAISNVRIVSGGSSPQGLAFSGTCIL